MNRVYLNSDQLLSLDIDGFIDWCYVNSITDNDWKYISDYNINGIPIRYLEFNNNKDALAFTIKFKNELRNIYQP